MQFDRETLGALRERHAAWQLLRYEHAATTIAFLHRVFIEPNLRSISQSELIGALDDQLYGGQAFSSVSIFSVPDAQQCGPVSSCKLDGAALAGRTR